MLSRVGVLVGALVAVLLITPASAVSSGGSVDGERAVLAEVLVRDFDIGKDRALRNVDLQTRARGIVDKLQDALGPGFAGVWFDNPSSTFRVGVADEAFRERAQQTLIQLGVDGDSELVPVRSTWAELEAEAAEITQSTKGLKAAVGINAVENSVDVTVAASTATKAAEVVAEVEARSAVDVNVVHVQDFVFDGVQPDACAHPYCDRPLGGAIRINGPASCTAGFLAFSNVNLVPYILTAGHCFGGGGNWWTYHSNHSSWSWIGPSHNWTYGAAGDAGIVRITDPFWNVAGGKSAKIAAWTTGNGNYLIFGGAWSYFGLALCKYGATRPRECGSVNNASLINGNWWGIGHLTYMTACGQGGDSGGPHVAGNVGFGVHHGSYGCPTAGAFFTEAVAAGNAMNVYVASAS